MGEKWHFGEKALGLCNFSVFIEILSWGEQNHQGADRSDVFFVYLTDSLGCILKSRFADFTKLSLMEKTQRGTTETGETCCSQFLPASLATS